MLVLVVWQVPGRRDVHIVVGTDGEGENAAVVGEQLDPNLQEQQPSDKSSRLLFCKSHHVSATKFCLCQ